MPFELIPVYLKFTFIWRAIIVGLLTSLCAGLIGVNLVLKRYSMIGDGLSHVGFGILAITVVIGLPPLQTAIPIILIVAFLLLRLRENSKTKGDAAIALISVSALAIGVTTFSLTSGMNSDMSNYMFGSILTLTESDLYVCIVTSTIVLLVYVLFYAKNFALTFDSDFAKASGVRVDLYNLFTALMTALIVVVGMRMMGAMLISGLIIFPPLTAIRLFKSYKMVAIASGVLSTICFIIGILASFVLSTPVGASVIITNLCVFCLCLIIGYMKILIKKHNRRLRM
ncbi:MAG: metal ABC transporter permease [Christensenellaceae bacterium]|jgi:zinc transport system permease protein|nr:metal ABC transporter permease [Christensenellaceae bacterium]